MTKTKIYEIEILNDEQLDNVTGGEGRPQPVKTRELFKKVIDWIKKIILNQIPNKKSFRQKSKDFFLHVLKFRSQCLAETVAN